MMNKLQRLKEALFCLIGLHDWYHYIYNTKKCKRCGEEDFIRHPF